MAAGQYWKGLLLAAVSGLSLQTESLCVAAMSILVHVQLEPKMQQLAKPPLRKHIPRERAANFV